MKKMKSLNAYQKGILIFMTAIALIFAVIYPITISKVGYKYNDTILVPTEENGNTVYSGKIEGVQAQFVVSKDNTVVFNYGEKTYGPYTVIEDASAVPKDNDMSASMTGIEVREGNEILFRGGIMAAGSLYWLYNEDGTTYNNMYIISYVTSDGVERDENGNPIDRMKPQVTTIYKLVNNPELTHKGIGLVWFGTVFICVINAITILFADELFRFALAFRVRDPEDAEPSDWVIMGKYISWTVVAIAALALFIIGLQ